MEFFDIVILGYMLHSCLNGWPGLKKLQTKLLKK